MRIIFVPQLISFSELTPFLSQSSKKNKENETLLKQVISVTDVEVFDISLDRLSNIRALREAVKRRIPTLHLTKSEGEVLLLESTPGQLSCLSRFLKDNVSVTQLQSNCLIYAYCPPATLANQTIVLQVKSDF